MSRSQGAIEQSQTEQPVRAINRRTFLSATAVTAGAAAVGGFSFDTAAAAPTGLPSSAAAAVRRIKIPFVTVRPQARRDLTEATLAEAATMIRRGTCTAVQLVSAHLDRADRFDGVYQAFNARTSAAALAAARDVDRGRRVGPLAGIPLTIKDNFFTRGVKTTANSLIFAEFVPNYDATAYARLNAAGGVMVGKGQMGPLATTRATLPNGTITTVNAWAPNLPMVDPGGSSTGPATSVAGRMVCAAIGTQTGGSIVLPANQQNLTGLKPTMGRVSLHGVIPLTYTRDHIGPLARDGLDAAIMLHVMAGQDANDVRTQGLPKPADYITAALPVRRNGRTRMRRRTRIGVPPGYLAAFAGEAAGLQKTFLAALDGIPGADLVEVEYPDQWSLLSSTFNSVRLPERTEPFLPVLQRDPTLFGVSLTSWAQGLFLSGDEWITGQRAKHQLLRQVLDDVMGSCDVLLQTSVVPFDILGLPELGLPIGFTAATETTPALPVGAIIGGQPYEEERLLEVAAAYQDVTDWHLRRPADPATVSGQSRRAAPLALTPEEVAKLTA